MRVCGGHLAHACISESTQLVPSVSGGRWLPLCGIHYPPATSLVTLQGEHEAGRPTPGSWGVPDGKVEGKCLLGVSSKVGCPLVWDGEPCQPQLVPGPQASWEKQLALSWFPLRVEGNSLISS